MNRLLLTALLLCLLLFAAQSQAQNVAINTDGSLPNPNAILDIKSFDKGILIPRVSTSGRLSIPNIKGMLVYDTTVNSFWYNTGATWQNMTPVTGGGDGSNGWLLHGNAGTDTSNFLGTVDNKPLMLRVNNKRIGVIDETSVRLGLKAGGLLIAGQTNVAIGVQALQVNTTGDENTAVGRESMFSNTTGFENSAFGQGSLFFNITGRFNTAIGAASLINNTTGEKNTALGLSAMHTNFRGNSNTAIGFNADVARDSLNNATAVGNNAIVNASNKIRLGNSAVTVIEGQVPFTTPSDGRFKYQVQEDVKGLDFILQLRPVTYRFDVKQFDEQLGIHTPDAGDTGDNALMRAAYIEAANMRRSGFIAQEVEKAANATGYNFSGLTKPKNSQEYYSLSYESFVVPLVKATQQQYQLSKTQQAKIEQLEKTTTSLQQQLDELRQVLQNLHKTN